VEVKGLAPKHVLHIRSRQEEGGKATPWCCQAQTKGLAIGMVSFTFAEWACTLRWNGHASLSISWLQKKNK